MRFYHLFSYSNLIHIQIDMSDIALDDLIEKDKKKFKEQKHKAVAHKNKNFHKGGRTGFQANHQRQERFHNQPKLNDQGFVPKRKFIQKPGNRGGKINRNFQRDERQQTRQPNNAKFNQTNKPNRPFNNQNRQNRTPKVEESGEQRQNEGQQKGKTLRVMGLHPDFTNQDLYKLFATEGALQKCLIEQDNFGRSLTTAVVKYHNATSATNAITNLNNHKVMNSILTVEPYRYKKR